MVINSRAMASSQVGAVAVSFTLATLRSLRSLEQEWTTTLLKSLKPLLDEALNKVSHIIVDDTAWLCRSYLRTQLPLKHGN